MAVAESASISQGIAARYATALFELAKEAGALPALAATEPEPDQTELLHPEPLQTDLLQTDLLQADVLQTDLLQTETGASR